MELTMCMWFAEAREVCWEHVNNKTTLLHPYNRKKTNNIKTRSKEIR